MAMLGFARTFYRVGVAKCFFSIGARRHAIIDTLTQRTAVADCNKCCNAFARWLPKQGQLY